MMMSSVATNGTAVTMAWKQLGNVLRPADDAGLHECAIVLSLEPALRREILRTRRGFGSGMVANQLEPHITLLYCGVREAAEIARLAAIAARHAIREVEFAIMGIGHFTNATGQVTNLHYGLGSPALHALHGELAGAYADAGFAPCTPYAGARYYPHISLFDRVVLEGADAGRVPLPTHTGPYRAGGAHLIGERRAPPR